MARQRDVSLLLFLFTLSVFLLSYSGLLHSDDEMSMVAVTESIVKRGNFAIDQIAWNQDQAGGIGRYGLDGHLYSKYGWAQSVLAIPLYALAMLIPIFGLVQTTMLFNSLVTALTSALLYLLAQRLGFSRASGILLSLVFSFTTLAWVYAKYFFSEPLTALLLVAAFYFLIGKDEETRNRDFLFAGILLGLSVATKSANLVLLPFYYLLPFVSWWRTRPVKNTPLSHVLIRLLAMSIPIAVFGATVGAYNFVRFGSPFDAGYNPDETFNGDLFVGVYGLLFSPGKSLFLYSPILFVFFLGFPAFIRRNIGQALVILAIILTTILLYGKWHAWHGGWGWGPRFLVPIIPFLLIGALPFLDDMLRRRSPILYVPFTLVTVVSFLLTLLGVSVDFNLYLLDVMRQHSEFRAGAMFFTIMDAAASPIPGQIKYLLSGNLDFIWAHIANGVMEFNPSLLAFSTALIPVSFGFLIRELATPVSGKPDSLAISEKYERLSHFSINRALMLLSIVLLTVFSVSIVAAGGDSRIKSGKGTISQVLEYLSTRAGTEDALIINAPEQTHFLMNFDKARYEVYGLLKERNPLSEQTEKRLEGILSRHRQVWLFQESAPYADSSLGIEVWLDKHGFKAENKWFDQSRLVRYSIDSNFATRSRTTLVLGEVLAIEQVSATAAAPGGILGIQLSWRSLYGNAPRSATSIRLVDQQSQVVAQKDREPTDSLLPTSAWRKDEIIQDRLGLPLSRDLKPGIYNLMVVVYTVDGTRPLTLKDGSQLVNLGALEIK